MGEPGTRTGGNQRRRGRYQRRVGLSSGMQAEFKRNIVKPGGRGPRLGETKSSPLRLRGRRIGDREVVQERFAGPVLGVGRHAAVGLVGRRAEAVCRGGELRLTLTRQVGRIVVASR